MSTEEMREAVSFAGRTVVRREPAGVAAVIASWSYPLVLAFCQLAPALAAGCTIVLKPAAETSLSAYIVAWAACTARRAAHLPGQQVRVPARRVVLVTR